MERELQYLKEYYNNYKEEERLLSQHGKVEYVTTMKYIHQGLTPENRILEIGAGTGRYSLALSGEGYQVDALELVESNVRIMQQ